MNVQWCFWTVYIPHQLHLGIIFINNSFDNALAFIVHIPLPILWDMIRTLISQWSQQESKFLSSWSMMVLLMLLWLLRFFFSAVSKHHQSSDVDTPCNSCRVNLLYAYPRENSYYQIPCSGSLLQTILFIDNNIVGRLILLIQHVQSSCW